MRLSFFKRVCFSYRITIFYFFTACTRASQSDEVVEKDSEDQQDYKLGYHYGLTIRKGMLARLTDVLKALRALLNPKECSE